MYASQQAHQQLELAGLDEQLHLLLDELDHTLGTIEAAREYEAVVRTHQQLGLVGVRERARVGVQQLHQSHANVARLLDDGHVVSKLLIQPRGIHLTKAELDDGTVKGVGQQQRHACLIELVQLNVLAGKRMVLGAANQQRPVACDGE